MYKASLSGTKSVVKLNDGMEIVELTTPQALDYESEYMGHCVGQGGYDEGVKQGYLKIYSLRDKDGAPHATFEVRINKETQKEEYYDIYSLPKGFVVKGDLDFSHQGLTELPDLSSVIVKGDFGCSRNQLTSLAGAPQSVGGSFWCDEAIAKKYNLKMEGSYLGVAIRMEYPEMLAAIHRHETANQQIKAVRQKLSQASTSEPVKPAATVSAKPKNKLLALIAKAKRYLNK